MYKTILVPLDGSKRAEKIEQDKVKNRLGTMIHSHKDLRDQFFAKITNINLVLNNDPLSLAEAVRIQQKLNDIDIKAA